jgi:hypothetical protein
MQWCIYYTDGSTYSDLSGEAWYAPKSGVQAIVVADSAVHHIILSRADFYCYNPDWDVPVWRSMDDWGMQEYMREPGPRLVVYGQWTGNHAYQTLMTHIHTEWGERQRYPDDRT